MIYRSHGKLWLSVYLGGICESLLEALVALKAQDYSKYQKRLKKICGAALLILDDFLLHTITDEREVKILFEILEKRC